MSTDPTADPSPQTTQQPAQGDDRSAAELVKQVSEQTSRLVRQEMALARLELGDKLKHAGVGAGLFGGTALLGLLGAGTLVAAVVLALATAMDDWLAALIVAAALLAGAAILARTGKGELERATPAAPEQTVENVQADIDEVRRSARS
jgi:uncharacterized membrane protein YqjE